MPLRTSRVMTSLFLVHDDRVLLLYRRGSRAISDSWVGIGGHVEPSEISDPTSAILREMHEEVGLTPKDVTDLSLRYIALRDTGRELRSTYYFTARLKDGAARPQTCSEGDLAWFDQWIGVDGLDMPPTAKIALGHWLHEGRHDNVIRSIVMGVDGPQVVDLAHG
ncbi:NUDIX domain-containing protein [Micromonospora soli]|uniref:NUDIX domain-containing protein n=1 Tax=Micromonospora sp. NBRC 110009 TaxID=3061627 RepID=UPI002671E0FE|nr:NUDIX domain-containing protein [Micromonospora sp. NBRC 110009]WKT97579.1 NUDIX domain-containing protein [Micromonospora sp. NBRC 110009]